MNKLVTAKLEKIAAKNTSFESFDENKNGDDFKEVAVWSLKKALEEAYALGWQDGLKTGRKERAE